jgi:hypothetical protein
MRSGFLDVFTRIVMLVLAGLVSLSIIGGIAAMSEGGGAGGFVLGTRPQPPPQEGDEIKPRPAEAAQPEGLGGTAGMAQGPPPVAAAAGGRTKWFEAIAYALYAIAGLAALLALILWRMLAELRRAAKAAEKLAERNAGR